MKKLISVLFCAALLAITNTHVSASTDILGPSIIHKEANQIFTIMDLLELYDDMDVFATDDGFTGNGNIPGEYTVILSKGFEEKAVTIVVIEDWGNLLQSNDIRFVADLKDIYIVNDRYLTPYEIIYYIYDSTGYVETDYTFTYEIILDEYSSAFVDGIIPEGTYEHNFRLNFFSGEQKSYRTYINTIELPEVPGVVLSPPPTAIEQLMGLIPVIIVGVLLYIGYKKLRSKRGFRT